MEKDYEYALLPSENQDEMILVKEHDACPQCGERRADWLIPTGSSQGQVRCITCGRVFEPSGLLR
jgi:DNA-directed RNA polymerase subunit RPC12/RpoP